MISALRAFSYRKNKALPIVVGYMLLTHASICFSADNASKDTIEAAGNINQTNEGAFSPLANIDIKSSNNLISVNINNAPLRHVLKKLSTQNGIEIWISDSVKPTQITAHFEMLPVDEALRRLLDGSSYILVNNDKNNTTTVKSIYILPLGEEQPSNAELMLSKLPPTEADVLTNALKSNSIPNNVKAAILDQIRMNTSELQQTASSQRKQAIHKLIKQLEKVGKADPKTLHQLHKKYGQLTTQKQIE